MTPDRFLAWPRRHSGDLVAIGLLALVTVAAWAVFPIAGKELLFGPDATEQTWSWWQFNIAELQAGRLPLWNPFVSAGMSNVGEGQMGALYPPTMAVALLGGAAASSMGALLLLSALHFALSAMGGYLLTRIAGFTAGPAAAAAVVIALSGAMLWRSTGQLNIYWAMSWVPLAVALCWATLRFGQFRWAPLAGAAFALSLAAGHAQGVVIGTVVVLVVAVVLLLPATGTRRPGLPVARSLLGGAVVLASFALLALPQLWAEIAYLGDAYRWVGAAEPVRGFRGVAYEAIAANSHLGWSDALSAFLPSRTTPDGSILIGLPAIVMAILGLLARGEYRRIRFLGIALVALGLLVALGPRTPFLVVWAEIPFVSQVRQPIRFDVVMVVGIALLVAVGCQTWFRHSVRRWAALSLVVIAAGAAALLAGGPAPQWVLVGAVALAGGLAAYGLRRHREALFAGIAACMIGATLVSAWWLRLPDVGTQSQTPTTWFGTTAEEAADEVREFAAETGTEGRVRLTDTLPRNLGTVERIATVSGYSATLPAAYFDLLVAFGFDDRVWDLLAVDAVVEHLDGEVVVTTRPDALPLAWYAESVLVVADESPAAVANAGVDLGAVAVLGRADSGDVYCDGSVSVRSRTPAGIEYSVECERGGFLVLSEIWDAGWRAYVDGEPVELVRVDHSLIGIRTPPSAASVEMRYEPRAIVVGVPLAVAGSSLVAVLAVVVILFGRGSIGGRRGAGWAAAIRARLATFSRRGSDLLKRGGRAIRLPSHRVGLVVIAASLAIAFIAGTALVRTVGLQYDEALFVNGATDPTTTHFVGLRVAGIPILLMDYIGALKAWIFAPIFALFGVSIETIRVPMVAAFVVSIALLVRIMWVRTRPWVAVLAGVLLVLEPAFTLMARNDWGPVALSGLLRVCLLGALIVAIETRRRRWAVVAAAVLALGIFNKLDFAISGAALLVAVLIVYAPVLWAACRRSPLTAVAVAGGFFAVFVAAYDFMYSRAAGTVGGFEGTWLERFESRLNLVRTTFDGDLIVGYMTGEDLSLASYGLPVACVVAVVVIVVAIVDRRSLREARPEPGGTTILPLFTLSAIAGVATFVGLVLASEVTGPHHAALLWPFPWLVIALGCGYLIEVGRRRRVVRPVAAFAGLLTGALLVGQAATSVAIVSVLVSTSERPSVWTGDTGEVADILHARVDSGDEAIVITADWGIANQLIAYDADERELDVRDIWPAIVATPSAELVASDQIPAAFFLTYHTGANEIFAGGGDAARELIRACRAEGGVSTVVYRGDDLIVREVRC